MQPVERAIEAVVGAIGARVLRAAQRASREQLERLERRNRARETIAIQIQFLQASQLVWRCVREEEKEKKKWLFAILSNILAQFQPEWDLAESCRAAKAPRDR